MNEIKESTMTENLQEFKKEEDVSISEKIVVIEEKEPITPESRFNGKLIQLIGWMLLIALLEIVTIGLITPVAMCWIYKWYIKHSIIDGKRLEFVGRCGAFFGKCLLWLLLSIITLTIFAWFVPMKIARWFVSNTHIITEETVVNG